MFCCLVWIVGNLIKSLTKKTTIEVFMSFQQHNKHSLSGCVNRSKEQKELSYNKNKILYNN